MNGIVDLKTETVFISCSNRVYEVQMKLSPAGFAEHDTKTVPTFRSVFSTRPFSSHFPAYSFHVVHCLFNYRDKLNRKFIRWHKCHFSNNSFECPSNFSGVWVVKVSNQTSMQKFRLQMLSKHNIFPLCVRDCLVYLLNF